MIHNLPYHPRNSWRWSRAWGRLPSSIGRRRISDEKEGI